MYEKYMVLCNVFCCLSWGLTIAQYSICTIFNLDPAEKGSIGADMNTEYVG